MTPIFTVHAGEYLVGTHLERMFRDCRVWIPSKDFGIDLLLTDRSCSRAISLQVKYSRDYADSSPVDPAFRAITQNSFLSVQRQKIEKSPARYWVIVLKFPRKSGQGAENDCVTIPNDNFGKARAACNAFGCIPYFAIFVDAGEVIRGFILPMKRLLTLFPEGKSASYWKMAERYLKKYAEDPEIQAFEFRTKTTKWWGQHNCTENGSRPILLNKSKPATAGTAGVPNLS